jgi:hypothetical protein
MVVESNQQGFRLATYWLTVVAFALSWTWFVFDSFEKTRVNYLEPIGEASIPMLRAMLCKSGVENTTQLTLNIIDYTSVLNFHSCTGAPPVETCRGGSVGMGNV